MSLPNDRHVAAAVVTRRRFIECVLATSAATAVAGVPALRVGAEDSVVGLLTGQSPSASRAVVEYQLPVAGHVTIAINDAGGKRVRNLFADIKQTVGFHRAPWDGLDDQGRVMPPGEYHWVGLVRGALHAVYRGAFTHGNPPWFYGKTGGWLADHYPPSAVVSVGTHIFLGSGVAEWGNGLVCCDLAGNKIWGVRWLSQAAWCGVAAMVTDGQRIFATSFPGWTGLNWVWEVDPENGNSWPVVKMPATVPAHPKSGLRVVGSRKIGPTRWDGELYVSEVLGKEERTFVYSTARAPAMKLLRVLPVRTWGLTWLPDGRCIAALDKSLAVLDTATGKTTAFVEHGLEAPFAITSDPQGRCYVSDRGGEAQYENRHSPLQQPGLRTSKVSSMQVKIFDRTGKLLRTMGKAGGQGPGLVNPLDFKMPGGLAIDPRGRLWVTEENYTKRVSVWNIPRDLTQSASMLAQEFFGPSDYGEGAYMTDPKHPRRITSGAAGIVWDVDLSQGTFKPVELPQCVYGPSEYSFHTYQPDFPLANYSFESPFDNWLGMTRNTVSCAGRIFRWYSNHASSYAVIGEQKGAGDFKPLAAFGSISNYIVLAGQYSDHWIPLPMLEAAKRRPDWNKLARAAGLDPAMTDFPHDLKLVGKWPGEINAFNWTDANGDGRMQPEEIKLSRQLVQNGFKPFDVDAQLDALVSIRGNLYRMKRLGFNGIGAPIYDWSKAQSCSQGSVGTPTYVGPEGQMLVTPNGGAGFTEMRLLAGNGDQQWSYPTKSPGHTWRELRNPMEKFSQPGVVYGSWNMQGVVSGPGDLGGVFLLHGGAGRDYLFTLQDGLFIGTIFRPAIYGAWLMPNLDNVPQAKPGMFLENYSLQQECFNGSIVQAEASEGGFEKGHYYLLGLGRRIVVELTGLDAVRRLPGGQFSLGTSAVETVLRQRVAVARKNKPSAGDVLWASAFSSWMLWYNNSQCNPIVLPDAGRFRFWYNKTGLGFAAVLCYCYRPGIPLSQVFVNPAPSWEEAFAYGDCVDLLIGPAVDPNRITPVAGDQRLVFAQRDGKLEIVRYRWMRANLAAAGARVLAAGRQGAMAWVADKLAVPNDGVTRSESPVYNTAASFQMTIPWSVLGIDYQPGMTIRADVGVTLRRPADAGISRQYWTGDVGSYDLATALEMHPDLWRTLVLRPQGYVLPPDISAQKPAEADKPLAVNLATQAAGPPAHYAGTYTWVTWDKKDLKLKWYVTHDAPPLVNNGGDWTRLFTSGDACSLQIQSPTLGKCQYLISTFKNRPIVVFYRYVAQGAKPNEGVWYRSPVGAVYVPVVERLAIKPVVLRGKDWYTVEVAIPWTVLGIVPKVGLEIPAELGVLRADPTGSRTASRNYWSSGRSGTVSDVPTQVRPTGQWGRFKLH